MTQSAGRALVRLHAGAGARAGLRAGTIGVSLVIFAFGSAPEPAWTLRTFVLAVVAAPATWGAVPQARLLLALLTAALALVAARRVAAGTTGWMASLPVDARTARQAAWVATMLATLPVVVFLVGALVLAPALYGVPPHLPAVVTLPLLPVAAAACALGVRVRWARALAGAALVLAAWPRADAALAALALLALWDRYAGGLAAPRPTRARRAPLHPSRPPAIAGAAGAFALAVRWTWRAAGARQVLEAIAVAALPLGFARLVQVNNPDLSARAAAVAACLGAGLALTATAAALAGTVLARRAPWAWARTLPCSARQRVLVDVAALGAPAGVVTAAAVVAFGWRVLPAAAAVALVVACAGAGALRAGAARQTGAVGETALAGAGATALLAAWPAVALVAPVAAALLVVAAARRERRRPDAVRWNELRHALGGDAAWIART